MTRHFVIEMTTIVALGLMGAVTGAGCGAEGPDGSDGPEPTDAAREAARAIEARLARTDEELVAMEVEARRHATLQARPDGTQVWVLPPADVVAAFTTRDGRSARFEWQRLTDDLIYVERTKDGQPPLFGDDVSLLERYLRLAPEGAAVPRAIAFADEVTVQRPELLTGRDLVDAVAAAMVDDERVPAPPVVFAVTPSCGGSGAATFADNHCYYLNNGLIPPNRHDPLWCCDENFSPADNSSDNSGSDAGCLDNSASGNNFWFELNRTTASTRWNSYSRTAACGNSAHVWHDYLTPLGDWGGATSEDLDEDDVVAIFYKGGAKRHRKIHHHRDGSSGGVRAYSEFTNNF